MALEPKRLKLSCCSYEKPNVYAGADADGAVLATGALLAEVARYPGVVTVSLIPNDLK